MITDRINVDSIIEIFAYDSNFKYRQKKEFNFFATGSFDTT
jgi:hypothetical protein